MCFAMRCCHRHGLPAALLAAFFGGSLLIETLFSLDGLGLLSYESIVRRDYPVVLASVYLAHWSAWASSCCATAVRAGRPAVQFGEAAQ